MSEPEVPDDQPALPPRNDLGMSRLAEGLRAVANPALSEIVRTLAESPEVKRIGEENRRIFEQILESHGSPLAREWQQFIRLRMDPESVQGIRDLSRHLASSLPEAALDLGVEPATGTAAGSIEWTGVAHGHTPPDDGPAPPVEDQPKPGSATDPTFQAVAYAGLFSILYPTIRELLESDGYEPTAAAVLAIGVLLFMLAWQRK